MLTGTPLLGKPDQLWNVLQAADLATEAFASWPYFCELFHAQRVNMAKRGRPPKWVTVWPKSGRVAPGVPEMLRRVSLRRRREDVLPDLPVKTYETMEFECVTPDLRAICDEVVAALRKRGLRLEDAIAEAIETKAGVVFEAMSRVRSRLATAKIPQLLEYVEQFEEAQEPVIVFSRHRGPVDALATRPGWGTITGDQTGVQRQHVVDAFQAGRLKGICATIQAGGVAVTLTRGHRVVFVDLDYTPALNQQAEDRLCRIGQTRGVIVTRIVADHDLDRRVIEILGRKQALIDSSVEASSVGRPTLELKP